MAPLPLAASSASSAALLRPLVGRLADAITPDSPSQRRREQRAVVVESGPGLSDGAIAGIVIGSILGTLLLVWFLYSCCHVRRRRYRAAMVHEKVYHHPARRASRHRYHHESHLRRPSRVYSTRRNHHGRHVRRTHSTRRYY